MIFDLNTYYIDQIQKQDAWNICDFVVANEDRLKLYFPLTLQQNLTPELATIFSEKKTSQFNKKEEFLFTLKPKNSNKILGLIYIKELDWTTKQGEFAYCIDYNFESKGIITKAVNFLSKHAFNTLGLKTLQIIVNKDNLGSVMVAKKCNFTWIKTLEKEYTPPGKTPLNMELYELYKDIE